MAGNNRQGLHSETLQEAVKCLGVFEPGQGYNLAAERKKLKLAVAKVAGCGGCPSYKNGECSPHDSIPELQGFTECDGKIYPGLDPRGVNFYEEVGVPLCQQMRLAKGDGA